MLFRSLLAVNVEPKREREGETLRLVIRRSNLKIIRGSGIRGVDSLKRFRDSFRRDDTGDDRDGSSLFFRRGVETEFREDGISEEEEPL